MGTNMLGLDIDEHAIYAVRLKSDRILGHGMCLTPPECVVNGVIVHPLRVAESIRRLCGSLHVREPSVCLSIGGPGVMSKWVEVPRVSEEELTQSTPYEAPRHLPPSTEPMLYRFWVPPEALQGSSETMAVRLIAVPQAMVYSRLESAYLAGLEPVMIMPEADAVVRVLTREHASTSLLWRGKATAILNMRYGYTEMSVARETYLEFTRNLKTGMNDLLDTLAGTLGASDSEAGALLEVSEVDEHGTLRFPEEMGLPPVSLLSFLHDLTSEMRRLMDFQRSRFPEGSYLGLLDTFVMAGEGAKLTGLTNYCSKSLGVTCITGNLQSGLHWLSDRESIGMVACNPYATALGLAMRTPVSTDSQAAFGIRNLNHANSELS
jgi:type IV pilus assembly protein PilM